MHHKDLGSSKVAIRLECVCDMDMDMDVTGEIGQAAVNPGGYTADPPCEFGG